MYLSDIFDKLSGWNFSLRVPNTTMFQLFDKVLAFLKMAMLCKRVCESDALEIFVNMSEYKNVITYFKELNVMSELFSLILSILRVAFQN
jgi:hypothetical protein